MRRSGVSRLRQSRNSSACAAPPNRGAAVLTLGKRAFFSLLRATCFSIVAACEQRHREVEFADLDGRQCRIAERRIFCLLIILDTGARALHPRRHTDAEQIEAGF